MKLLIVYMIFTAIFLPIGMGESFDRAKPKAHKPSYRWNVSSYKISPRSALTLKYDSANSTVIIGCYGGGGLYAYDLDTKAETQLIKGFNGGVSAIELINLGTEGGVVVSDEFKGLLKIYRLGGDTKLLAVFRGLESITDIVTGDFDQDGLVDIAFSVAQGSLSFWLKNIDNKRFKKVWFKERYHYRISGLEAVDVDQDNDLDLIVYSEELGIIEVMTNEKGEFSTTFRSKNHKGVMDIKVADMDKDNDLDLIMVSHLKKEVTIFRNQHKGYYKDEIKIPVKKPTSILVKDFNGDDLPDLLITSFSKSPLYLLQNGLDKFYGVNIEADVSGATEIIAIPGGKEGKTDLVVSSFDKRLLYKLELDAIE